MHKVAEAICLSANITGCVGSDYSFFLYNLLYLSNKFGKIWRASMLIFFLERVCACMCAHSHTAKFSTNNPERLHPVFAGVVD